jgi:hypothetical protein
MFDLIAFVFELSFDIDIAGEYNAMTNKYEDKRLYCLAYPIRRVDGTTHPYSMLFLLLNPTSSN